jgi:hypothetical protein
MIVNIVIILYTTRYNNIKQKKERSSHCLHLVSNAIASSTDIRYSDISWEYIATLWPSYMHGFQQYFASYAYIHPIITYWPDSEAAASTITSSAHGLFISGSLLSTVQDSLLYVSDIACIRGTRLSFAYFITGAKYLMWVVFTWILYPGSNLFLVTSASNYEAPRLPVDHTRKSHSPYNI